MSVRSEEVILEQVLAAIDGALAYANVPKAEFLADLMRQDAVVRKLEIIGEAAWWGTARRAPLCQRD